MGNVIDGEIKSKAVDEVASEAGAGVPPFSIVVIALLAILFFTNNVFGVRLFAVILGWIILFCTICGVQSALIENEEKINAMIEKAVAKGIDELPSSGRER